jgi:hypothetical protein
VVLCFAALGAVVLALTAERSWFGDDCCSGKKWQANSAQFKLATLWENIIDNLKPASWPGVKLGLLFAESMDPTFDRIADDLPWDRSKLIHSVGNHAQAKWVANSVAQAKYTGIFKSGGKYAIVRLSPAAEPEPDKGTDPSKCDPQCGFVPGLSLKVLRSGVLSANLFSMYSLVGQPSFDFFKNNFTNHPPLDCDDIHGSLKLLYMKFKSASNWPTMLGLSQFAMYDENGVLSDPPMFPYQLWFVPNPNLTAMFPDQPAPGWTDATLAAQLASIPEGTVLYTIFALENPWDPAEEIGSLQTTSNFTTSHWGIRTCSLSILAWKMML